MGLFFYLFSISELKVGDKVLSYFERTETTLYQPVMDIIQGEQRYQLIKLTLDSGESIETTAEHPFYIKGKGWNPASSLKVGEALQLHNGTTVVIKQIDTSVRVEKVYNLTVANTHNYFVGEDGVLVHNVRKKRKGGGEGRPHTEEEKALGDMLNEDTKRGKKPLKPKDAQAAMDLGKGLGLGTDDHRYGKDAKHWINGPHIHIDKCRVGGDKHIPALP